MDKKLLADIIAQALEELDPNVTIHDYGSMEGKREFFSHLFSLTTKERADFAHLLWRVVTQNGDIQFDGKKDLDLIRDGVHSFIKTVKNLVHKKLESGITITDPRIIYLIERAQISEILSKSPDGQIFLTGLVKWADNGFPQVTLGHKYAAALLVTNMAKDVLPMVKRPWTAFFIQVPPGLLQLYDNIDGTEKDVTDILVCEVSTYGTKNILSPKWSYVAMTSGYITMWRFGLEAEELLPPSINDNPYTNAPFCLEITDKDSRVSTMIGRLIINTCAAMTDKAAIKEIGPGHKAYRARQGREGPPITRTFQVGAPVKLDFREHVKKYIEEGGSRGSRAPVSVQTLVAGHFKSQPHGPQNSLRKVIWREPFWRGPEDAPINVRPHIIKDG